MKRRIIRGMSILLTVLSMSVLSGCGANANDKKEEAATSVHDHVEVIYFHGNMRCLTCRAIEKFAKETVDSLLQDNEKSDRLMFRVIDITENQDMADDYQTTGSSLFVTAYAKGKETRNDMTEFGFRTARRNHELFQDSLEKVILKSLEEINP